MGTCPESMCHSARLAQRDLPARQKKKRIKSFVTKKIAKEGRNILGFFFF